MNEQLAGLKAAMEILPDAKSRDGDTSGRDANRRSSANDCRL
jgi:hypothetical protein